MKRIVDGPQIAPAARTIGYANVERVTHGGKPLWVVPELR